MTVAMRSKVWNDLVARTLGSWVRIPLEAWMSVLVSSVLILTYAGSGLVTGLSPMQGVLLTIYKVYRSRLILLGNRLEGPMRIVEKGEWNLKGKRSENLTCPRRRIRGRIIHGHYVVNWPHVHPFRVPFTQLFTQRILTHSFILSFIFGQHIFSLTNPFIH
jgi:hypothetical protein